MADYQELDFIDTAENMDMVSKPQRRQILADMLGRSQQYWLELTGIIYAAEAIGYLSRTDKGHYNNILAFERPAHLRDPNYIQRLPDKEVGRMILHLGRILQCENMAAASLQR
jgi:hypothetical protein